MNGVRVLVGGLLAAGAVVLVTAVLLRPWSGPATAGEDPTRPGDASCDGFVDPVDAFLILQLDAALIPTLPCPANGDTNRDGAAGPIDAALILQFAAGLIDSLPPSTSTPVPGSTPARTPSPLPGSTPTTTPAPGITLTATATPLPPSAPTMTATPTPATCPPGGCPTATATPTPAPCPPGGCPTPTVTPTLTSGPSPIATLTPTPCPPGGCPTPTATPTPSNTPTPTPCPPEGCFVDFSIGIDVDGDTADDCSTKDGAEPSKCSLPAGNQSAFTLSVYLNDFDVSGYDAFDVHLSFHGVSVKDDEMAVQAPDCDYTVTASSATHAGLGCIVHEAPPSSYTGLIGTVGFNCNASGPIALLHGESDTYLIDDDGTFHMEGEGTSETLAVNCLSATPASPSAIERVVAALLSKVQPGWHRAWAAGAGRRLRPVCGYLGAFSLRPADEDRVGHRSVAEEELVDQ